MKKGVFIYLLLLFFIIEVQAQTNPFNEKEIIWYGLDFSAARLIGPQGFTNPSDIKLRYFNSWNEIILVESTKYDIRKYFQKDKVFYDLSVVEKRNSHINIYKLVINEDYSFEKDEVLEIVKSYETEQVYGVGLVFIVESFNKNEERAFIYVTFFDVVTKEVLFTEKVIGKPMGLSVRNYWAGSILDVMIKCRWSLLKWSKQFKKVKTAK